MPCSQCAIGLNLSQLNPSPLLTPHLLTTNLRLKMCACPRTARLLHESLTSHPFTPSKGQHFPKNKNHVTVLSSVPLVTSSAPDRQAGTHTQYRRDRADAGTKYRGAAGRKGTRFCICRSRKHHYLPIVQRNPFRPSPSHSATQSFQFSVKIFSWFTLDFGGGGGGGKPTLGGLEHTCCLLSMTLRER